jgi:hypothetical protein
MRFCMMTECAVTAGLLMTGAHAAELYVSPSGNDSAAGTIAAPLATIAGARDKVDKIKSASTPVTVYLRGGAYYLGAPVAFGPANSGTVQAPITYIAYNNEKPVISGGIKVTSTWKTYQGQIMVTTIAKNLKVDQLFLNGKRQVLARYPNFNAAAVILDGYAADCIGASRVARWADPTEGPGYIRALHSQMWGSWSEVITGKNGNAVTSKWVGDNGRTDFPGLHATYRMVENIFEELDAAGEWFYRKSTGELFFWPPSGTNLAAATVELASQDELLRFTGTSMAGVVSNIRFSGVTFTHTYRTLFSKPYEPITMSDWAVARCGAIFMQNAENIKIDNCNFDQVGGNGVFISGYNKNHRIYNNTFTDAGATCVAIMGPLSAIRCGRTRQNDVSCNDRTPGPLTAEYPSSITVDNNLMDHFGRFEKQPAGVALSATECDTIRHNTIHDCPRAGICFCDGCWGGHVVEYNWVYNSVLETGDHGPFNAWGRDRNGRWSSDTTATTLDARRTTIIRNNRFEVRPYFFGIDLDDQASNYTQYNNLLMGGGFKLQGTRYNTYVNNILANAMVEIHDVWANSKHRVAHNIFVCPSIYSFCCFNGQMSAPGSATLPDTIRKRVAQIDSNCIWSFGKTPVLTNFDNRSASVCTWQQWLGGGLDAHSILGDPLFTDTTHGDFRVKAGSPALTLGFRNFPMDSFGVMKVGNVAVKEKYTSGNVIGHGGGAISVRCTNGFLMFRFPGDFKAVVMTSQGKVVGSFKGSGLKSVPFKSGSGIYIVKVYSELGCSLLRINSF